MKIDLFGKSSKRMADKLLKENKALKASNKALKARNKQLVNLCNEKDSYFMEMISDGLRNGSKLAGKHMADRKSFLKGK